MLPASRFWGVGRSRKSPASLGSICPREGALHSVELLAAILRSEDRIAFMVQTHDAGISVIVVRRQNHVSALGYFRGIEVDLTEAPGGNSLKREPNSAAAHSRDRKIVVRLGGRDELGLLRPIGPYPTVLDGGSEGDCRNGENRSSYESPHSTPRCRPQRGPTSMSQLPYDRLAVAIAQSGWQGEQRECPKAGLGLMTASTLRGSSVRPLAGTVEPPRPHG